MSKHVLRKHVFGFTSVSNNVIKTLKNNLPALGLYLYLLSLPDNWEFYKTQICKDCGIGIKKLEKLLAELGSFELVQYGQKRNSKGQFSHYYMDVYDTESLKIKELEETVQPDGQNCRTVKTVERFREDIKEELTKEDITNKKEKALCSSDDEQVHEFTFFDRFWSLYPRKQKKKEAQNIWRRENLEEIAEVICENVKQRTTLEWKNVSPNYIPLPTSFLKGERWKDEVIHVKSKGLGVAGALSFALNSLKENVKLN